MTRNAPRASARSDEFNATRQRSSRRSPARDDDLQTTSATRRRSPRRQPDSDPLDLSATSPRLSLPSLSVPTPATMGRRKPAADARPAPPTPTAKRQTTLRERARISHSLRDVEDDWDESDWRDREWDEEPEGAEAITYWWTHPRVIVRATTQSRHGSQHGARSEAGGDGGRAALDR